MKATLWEWYEKERERLCRLAQTETSGEYLTPVFGEGCLAPALMLIGEAPGREESESGHPFVGKAGKQLDALLESAGIQRGEVFVTNAVKFRPTKPGARGAVNRTPTKKEVLAALPLLEAEVRLVRPRIIATLGNTPLFAVTSLSAGKGGTVGELHGKPHPFCMEGREGTLFPLYHPASTIYDRSLLPVLSRDIAALGELLQHLKG